MIHALFLTHGRRVPAAQLHPYHRHREILRNRLNFQFTELPLTAGESDAVRAFREDPDVVFFQDHPSREDSIVLRKLDLLQQTSPKTKTVFIDVSTYVSRFRLLPHFDLYLHKALYRDRRLHQEHFKHGRIFSDYMAERFGLSGRVRKRTPDPEEFHKVILDTNLGLHEMLITAFEEQGFRHIDREDRPIYVCCRVSTEGRQDHWYGVQRRAAIEATQRLGRRFRVVATEERLPRDEFLEEMRNSKITVSPFGWGEVCWRDFEAVISGSLLVKPSMSHLETSPDIYIDGETYVAVEWDWRDLEEKCVYYLEHEDEREAIIQRASRTYAQFIQNQEFVDHVGGILARLNL